MNQESPIKRNDDHNCNSCGIEEPWLLHNVGTNFRLCTSCVLISHNGSFCPICYHIFEGTPRNNDDRVTCSKCPSVMHTSCVTRGSSPLYVCPPCRNPNFVFFDIGVNRGTNMRNGGGSKLGDGRIIDVGSAKVLVAAAKIASVLTSKAASLARVNAEEKIKKLALARKSVSEALETVASLEREYNEKMGIAALPVTYPVELEESINKYLRYPDLAAGITTRVDGDKRLEEEASLVRKNGREAMEVDYVALTNTGELIDLNKMPTTDTGLDAVNTTQSQFRKEGNVKSGFV